MPRIRTAAIVLPLVLGGFWVAGFAVAAGPPTLASGEPEVGLLAPLPPFLPNVDITDGSSPYSWQVEPTMVVNRAGTVFVGWKEASTDDGPGRRVGFSYSDDGGASWAPNILMPQSHTTPGCANSDPWLARAPDDRVYYAYLEYDCESGIDFASTFDGRTWGPVHYLAGLGGLADKESIAVAPSGRLYAAWDEAFLGNELVVTWSDDGGATWAPFVTPSPTAALGVIVAVAPTGTVYLAWWDIDTNNILFDWSADRGTTWHADVRVNDVVGSAVSVGNWQIPIPAMNVDPTSGAIYIAWPDLRNGHQDIYAAASTNGGLTWSANHRMNDDPGAAAQWMVDLAVGADGVVHAAWEDRRTGNWNIFYSNSSDGGQTWTANLRVSDRDTPGTYERPGDYFAIEADSEAVYVAWTDGRGPDFDIYFARNPAFSSATVTITTEPAGLDVIVNGTRSPSPVVFTAPPGSTVTIEAPTPQAIGLGARYEWTSWSNGDSVAHAIAIGGSTTIVARFRTEFFLQVQTPYGSGLGAGWYRAGDVAYALASPSRVDVATAVRQVFAAWTGDASGTAAISNPIVMDRPKVAIAIWGAEYFVTVQSEFPGVTGEGWYAAGSIATLQAPAQVVSGLASYTFAGWTGDVVSPDLTVAVLVDRPFMVRAQWAPLGPLGLSPLVFASIVAVAVATVAGIVIVLWMRRRRTR